MEKALQLRRVISNIEVCRHNYRACVEIYPKEKGHLDYQFTESLRIFFKNFNCGPFFLCCIHYLPIELAYIRAIQFIEDLILIEEVKNEYFLGLNHDQGDEAQPHSQILQGQAR